MYCGQWKTDSSLSKGKYMYGRGEAGINPAELGWD